MIERHYRTLLSVYSRRQRAAFVSKTLLWFGAMVLFLLLAKPLQQKIEVLCAEYGENLIRIICYFLALFLLFSSVMEYRHIITGLYPGEDYSFYQSSGFSRRLYHILQWLQILPLCVLSVLLSGILCFPFVGTETGCVAFVAGWLILLLLCCILPDRFSQCRTGSGPLSAVRTGMLRRGRIGAMLAFSFSGAGKAILFFMILGLGTILAVVSPSIWIACWPAAWLSYYFTILSVNDYEKHAGFHQMLPRTYSRLICDNVWLSAIFCGTFLLIVGAVFVFVHGLSCESVIVTILMFLYALSNHAVLYLLLDPMIPAEKVTDTFAPVLILIAVLQVIPGFSLLLMMILWSRRRKMLNKSVPWGRRVC